MVSRHVYAEVPPRVEYELTERGHSRESVLWALWKWGARDQPTVAATGVP
jgi:DNA-binding HxlR family transcriptional regulator